MIGQLAVADEPLPLLHPDMAVTYQHHVERLVKALSTGEVDGQGRVGAWLLISSNQLVTRLMTVAGCSGSSGCTISNRSSGPMP